MWTTQLILWEWIPREAKLLGLRSRSLSGCQSTRVVVGDCQSLTCPIDPSSQVIILFLGVGQIVNC